MNIILADDEKLARHVLVSMLSEMDLPIQIKGEAKNGEELLKLIGQHQPDLVFVDIRMPKLNGIESIRIGKNLSPHTKWIIISGFNDFAYAREALLLGITDYLVKPVPYSELEQAVRQVLAERTEVMMRLNRQFEYDLLSVLHSTSELDHSNLRLPEQMKRYRYSITLLKASLNGSQEDASPQLAFNHHQIIKPLLSRSDTRCCLIKMPQGSTISFLAWDPQSEAIGGSPLAIYNRQLAFSFKDLRSDSFSIYALQAPICEEIGIIPETIAQLHLFTPLLSLLPTGQLHQCEDLKQLDNLEGHLKIGNWLARVTQLYLQKDYLNYAKALTSFEKDLKSIVPSKPADWTHAAAFLDRQLPCSLTGVRLQDWVPSLQACGINMLHVMSDANREQGDLIAKVIAYVDQHYMNDIGIAQIAEEVGMSPNYLSAIFHKKYGTTFTKYLIETRMLKAKELLLSQPNLQIQKIAEQVGYYSPRHFTKLFTQYFGSYPSEVREQFKS
ncbi:response regulator [Paenibacillus sp. PL91]|uniref:response regulator transcription factor n=1 Tax=Paenibacillus sp. PL91 TaxID=2729538 RepID=UPI00145CC55F|nr:helix-turn-helix domain-containing protein [Paenibacillus sp. PL91]MBC9201167.1 response regulator [Paenibacillus sp. PL91]